MAPESKQVKQVNKPTKPEKKPGKIENRSSKPAASNADRDDEFDDLDDAEFDDGGFDFEPGAPTPPPPDAKPTPVELPAPINPEGGRRQSVELHRNLFCLHYDECLDEAVKRGWNSFTCIRCAFYHTGNDQTGGVERFATQRKIS